MCGNHTLQLLRHIHTKFVAPMLRLLISEFDFSFCPYYLELDRAQILLGPTLGAICGECKEHSPLANVPIKVENSHFDNFTRLFTLGRPLFLQVLRANSPTSFPSMPLVSLFATCASSSASAPSLCLHHPDPSHLPISKIPLPISPTIPGGPRGFRPRKHGIELVLSITHLHNLFLGIFPTNVPISFPTSHFPTLFGGGVPSCLNT